MGLAGSGGVHLGFSFLTLGKEILGGTGFGVPSFSIFSGLNGITGGALINFSQPLFSQPVQYTSRGASGPAQDGGGLFSVPSEKDQYGLPVGYSSGDVDIDSMFSSGETGESPWYTPDSSFSDSVWTPYDRAIGSSLRITPEQVTGTNSFFGADNVTYVHEGDNLRVVVSGSGLAHLMNYPGDWRYKAALQLAATTDGPITLDQANQFYAEAMLAARRYGPYRIPQEDGTQLVRVPNRDAGYERVDSNNQMMMIPPAVRLEDVARGIAIGYQIIFALPDPEIFGAELGAGMSAGEAVETTESQLEVVFKSEHGARHLVGTGLSQDAVESAIRQRIQSLGTNVASHWGWVDMDSQWLQYRSYLLSDGKMSAGTYFPVSGLLTPK
jgi:hypothetical protein